MSKPRFAAVVFALCMAASRPSLGSPPEDSDSYDASLVGLDRNEKMKKFGLMFDVGSVDGGMLSGVYRPLPWLRLSAGGGTNTVSPGVRIGATFLPFGPGPSLSLEGGHYFAGDASGLARQFGSGRDASTLLDHFDYDFVNLHLGMELERGQVMVFLHGGMSFIGSKVDGLEQLEGNNGLSLNLDDGSALRRILPSLKLGFVGFL